MASGKWSTAAYSEEARRWLADAHREARKAAGYPFRPAYARAVGVSKESIVNLESRKPVGEFIVQSVGRFLPNWTKDSGVTILEGGPVPEPEIQSTSETSDDEQLQSAHPEALPNLIAEMRYFRILLGSDDFSRMMRLFEAMNESNRQFDERQAAAQVERHPEHELPQQSPERDATKAAG